MFHLSVYSMVLYALEVFFNSLSTLSFVDKFKIYISRRRLKDDLRMMAYSVPAAHHKGLLVFVVEIAIVGKDDHCQWCLCYLMCNKGAM